MSKKITPCKIGRLGAAWACANSPSPKQLGAEQQRLKTRFNIALNSCASPPKLAGKHHNYWCVYGSIRACKFLNSGYKGP